jgi:hypothetical protein
MNIISKPSVDELQKIAVRALKKRFNAEYERSTEILGRKLRYYIVVTDFGPRAFSVITRNFKSDGRYPLGFRPELFSHVDEFAIYLNREPHMYLVPQRVVVREIFELIEKPSINDQGQWVCNLNSRSHVLESKGLWPRADLSRYKVAV